MRRRQLTGSRLRWLGNCEIYVVDADGEGFRVLGVGYEVKDNGALVIRQRVVAGRVEGGWLFAPGRWSSVHLSEIAEL